MEMSRIHQALLLKADS